MIVLVGLSGLGEREGNSGWRSGYLAYAKKTVKSLVESLTDSKVLKILTEILYNSVRLYNILSVCL